MKPVLAWGGGTRAATARPIPLVAIAVICCACLLGSLSPAMALNKAVQHGVSSAPYWKVGAVKPELSRLCRQGKFNQVFKDGLYIGYGGKDNPSGIAITGIAKRGFNLYDPLGKADPVNTYHFKNDGYSNCTVYEAIPLQGAPNLSGGRP